LNDSILIVAPWNQGVLNEVNLICFIYNYFLGREGGCES